MESEQKNWIRNFIIILVANFVFCFGFYALDPTLPLYVSSLGGGDSQVGLVAMGFFISAVVTRILMGSLVDKIGQLTVLRIGAVLSVISVSLYRIVGTPMGVMSVRVLQGVGYGIVTTMLGSIAAEILPDSRRGEGISYLSMSTTAAVAFAPAVALSVINDRGFSTVFLGATGVILIAAICTYLIQALASSGGNKNVVSDGKASLWKKIYDPAVKIPILLLFIYSIYRSSEQSFLPLLAKQQGLAQLPLFFIVKTWVCFASKFFTGKLYDRKGPAPSIIMGAFSVIVAAGLLSILQSDTILLTVAALSGFALGQINPTLQVFVMDRIGRDRVRGNVIYYSFSDLGSALSAPLMGVVAGSFGYFKMFRVVLALMIVFLIVSVNYFLRKKEKYRNSIKDL